MKILFIDSVFYPNLYGGAQVQSWELCKRLVKRGHKVAVLTAKTDASQPDKELIGGIDINRVDARASLFTAPFVHFTLFYLLGLFKGIELVRRERIDVIHSSFVCGFLGKSIAKITGKPCVVTVHDFYLVDVWPNLLKRNLVTGLLEMLFMLLNIIPKYDRMMPVSHGSMKWSMKSEKIRVVYNGVDTQKYVPARSESAEPRIIFIGRIIPTKHIPDLIHAFDSVKERFSNAKLLIVGTGRLFSKLKAKCESDSIVFVGRISEKEKISLLQHAWLLVLPSTVEGFGLVLIEANACKKPFVCYGIPSCKEIANMTGGGLVVEPRDVRALTQAMATLIENKRLRHELGKTGYENVHKLFTWDKFVDRVESVYGELV
ncbi:MAG: glycosyltransferase family 4 protein [Candidatus Aenigmatarchaeota archaeon]